MPLRKALLLSSLIVTAACLAGGYGLAGKWVGAGIAILPPLALLFHEKISAFWLPPIFLSGAVCIAAAGLFEGASPFLMVLSAIAALAAWDLVNLNHSLEKSTPSPVISSMEKTHLRSLALALSLGALLAESGLLLTLQVPFIGVFLLVLLDLSILDRVYRLLNSQNRRGS